MTEILRYSQIGKQDLKIGTGQFEVRLGDGTVIVLDEIRLTDFLSALTVGSILFVKAGGVAGEDNANLFWDDTNNRLGIGTASPTVQLDMTGAAKIGLTLSVVGIILSDANLTWKSGTSFTGTLDHAITAARTWTMPDRTGTLSLALAVRVTHSSTQSIPNTTWTTLNFDTETFDTSSFHDTVTNNSRLIAPIAGKYLVIGVGSFEVNATGERFTRFALNGSASGPSQFGPLAGSSGAIFVTAINIFNLAANDYIELQLWQNSGVALNTNATVTGSYLSMFYLSE